MTRGTRFALILLLPFLLSACSPFTLPNSGATPAIDPRAAIREADALFVEYWKALQTYYDSGGNNVEALTPYADGAALKDAEKLVERMVERDWTLVTDYSASDTAFDTASVGKDPIYLFMTTCIDYSNAHTVHADGTRHPLNRESPRSIVTVMLEVDNVHSFDNLRIVRWDDLKEVPC